MEHKLILRFLLEPPSFSKQTISCFKFPSFRKVLRWKTNTATETDFPSVIESVEELIPTIEECKQTEESDEKENCNSSNESLS